MGHWGPRPFALAGAALRAPAGFGARAFAPFVLAAFLLGTLVLAACAFAALAPPAHAGRMGDPGLAAVQVGLRARGLYSGTIDGIAGPATSAAVRSLQRRHGLTVDGIAGPQTLRALGRRGRPRLGHRAIGSGNSGFDVAQLQFLLAWHGFPSGAIDGGFGSHTDAALRRFQRWAGTTADGVAGPATIRALLTPPRRSPLTFRVPIQASFSDGFGPRGNKFHPGLDFPAASGTAVFAARSGTVTWAGWRSGGYGYLVSVAHGSGVRTMYAHLSSIAVRRGARVAMGTLVGRVGSTGLSTGPHLHFEVRLRGAALDPARSF
jgi:murein DD-endopeptidase MepM/ murein hydrolase activator NlpD